MCVCVSSHQEPVDVHEQQGEEERVEEEVEGQGGNGLEARHTRGVQYFEREPVETEPEPGAGTHHHHHHHLSEGLRQL